MRKRKELSGQTIGYLKHRSSFLVAAFSLVAFIMGNTVGQHGWYAFWKAALGQYDDSLITYTGTVTPVAFVPDYTKWSTYGGNGEEHTFRQVPKDVLVPLPIYKQSAEKKDFEHSPIGDVYTIGNMGSYETGAEGDGSHIGVDIRVPQGTPVRAIANGIVTRVANDASGFGKLIVIRHPHAPDPDNPDYETVLHSGYAHLSAQFVNEGDIVTKGQEIGLSGKTGFATGPHLHFQIDRDIAPWHPYWAFSYSEAQAVGLNTAEAIDAGLNQDRGYEMTINPLLYVQANYPAAKFRIEPGKTIVKNTPASSRTVARAPSTRHVVTGQSIIDAAKARRQERMARRGISVAAAISMQSSSSFSSSSVSSQSVVVNSQTVADSGNAAPAAEPAPVLVVPQSTGTVAGVDIQHDRYFSGRSWEKVRLTLVDADGRTVSESNLTGKIYMRTAYGDAEFKPSILSASDFKNGVAEIEMLPRGRRTVVIQVQPLKSMSKPMEYVEE